MIAPGRGNGTDELTRKITLYINEGSVGFTLYLNRTKNDNHVPIAPHFGLGKAKAVDIRVTLPTGEVRAMRGVKAKSRAVADFQAGTSTTEQSP